MRVQSCCASRFEFFWRQELLEPVAFFGPLFIARIENLRNATPPDISHQRLLLQVRRRAPLRFEMLEKLDRRDVAGTFPSGRATAEFVLVGDSIVVLIAKRFRIGSGQSSAGGKMYLSQTISQARSCACRGVSPCWINC